MPTEQPQHITPPLKLSPHANARRAWQDGYHEAARRITNLQDLIDEQAEDEALWFLDVSVTEAYLQQELRRLHAVIEGITTKDTE